MDTRVTRTRLSEDDSSKSSHILYILTGADADAGEEVIVRNNVELGMYLFAPFADVSLDNNADIHGGVVGRRLTIKNNTVVLQPAVELLHREGGR